MESKEQPSCATNGEAMSGNLVEQDCVQTFDQVKDELEQVENKLARQLNLRSQDVRGQLFALARQEKLVEDDLVKRWHELYAVYADWLRHDPPPEQQTPEWEPPFRSISTGRRCPVCRECDVVMAKECKEFADYDGEVEAYCSECHARLLVECEVEITFFHTRVDESHHKEERKKSF